MNEYALQFVLTDAYAGEHGLTEALVRAALPVRRRTLVRAIEAWEINLWGAERETVERQLTRMLERLGIDRYDLVELTA